MGADLLQKMGWKEGEAIGKRSKAGTNALRALRRQDGLGLGAKIESQGGDSERSDHFALVLQNLQSQHKPSTKKKRSSNSDTTKLILAQNRVNAGHARKIREAKFGAKSADDLACIFGNRSLKTTGAVSENPCEDEVQEPRKRKNPGDKKKDKSKRRKTNVDA